MADDGSLSAADGMPDEEDPDIGSAWDAAGPQPREPLVRQPSGMAGGGDSGSDSAAAVHAGQRLQRMRRNVVREEEEEDDDDDEAINGSIAGSDAPPGYGSDGAGSGRALGDEPDATTLFSGFDQFKGSLMNRNVRAPEMFGVENNDGSAWTDIRFTSICGAGSYDTLYRGEGHFKPDDPNCADSRAPVSGTVRRARDDNWFDTRPREVTGALRDPSARMDEDTVRHVKPGVPSRCIMVNVAACLQTQNGKTVLDQNYSFDRDGTSANKMQMRALANAQVLSSIFEATEIGIFSGMHVEHQAMRDASAEYVVDGEVHVDGERAEAAAKSKKEKPPDVRAYMYLDHDEGNIERRMFIVLVERLGDKDSPHVTHGTRVWKLCAVARPAARRAR